MKTMIYYLAIAVLLSAFTGCATTLPMTSSLNDFVVMSAKGNVKDSVTFIYESEIVDGIANPYNRDKQSLLSGHGGYNHTESATLNAMVNEFIKTKFSNVTESGNVKIKLKLNDFWVEQYKVDSGGKVAAVALFGGEINIACVAKIKATLTIEKDGEQLIKNLIASSNDIYVQGVGTYTATSNYDRGKSSIQFVHAGNINKANNKLIMSINSFLESSGL